MGAGSGAEAFLRGVRQSGRRACDAAAAAATGAVPGAGGGGAGHLLPAGATGGAGHGGARLRQPGKVSPPHPPYLRWRHLQLHADTDRHCTAAAVQQLSCTECVGSSEQSV